MFPMRRNLVTVAGPETKGGSPGSPGVSPSADVRPGPPHRPEGSDGPAVELSCSLDLTPVRRDVLSRNTGDTVYTDNVKIIRVSFKSA